MSFLLLLPESDQDLEAWAANFDTRITATPTAFGLVAASHLQFMRDLSAEI